MMNTEIYPSKQQIKEFWEWCGIKRMRHQGEDGWVRPDIDYAFSRPPDLDLNNLFKYAVPKLREKYKIAAHIMLIRWIIELTQDWAMGKDTDPALALFWAIWEFIKHKQTYQEANNEAM